MNPKWKALLWEETRTGGVIAGWCFLFSPILWVAITKLLGYGPGQDAWRSDKEFFTSVVIGVPIFIALLLPLTTANSGHLKGGFSSRILLLPVDAWQAVTAALGMRTLFIGAVSIAGIGLCYFCFGDGPGFQMVFMTVNVYLLLQTFDWMRKPAPLLVILAVGTAVILLFIGFMIGGWGLAALEIPAHVLASPLTLLILAPLCFGLSLASASATRQGVQWMGGFTWRIPKAISLPTLGTARPFATAESAQFWYEMRTAGLFLPWLWLAAWGLLSFAVAFMVNIYSSVGVLKSIAAINIILEALPWLALILAMQIWGGMYGSPRAWKKTKQSLFLTLPPVATVVLARARMKAAMVCFALTLLATSLITTGHFLFSGKDSLWSFINLSMAQGESGVREWSLFLLWPTLIIASIAWGFAALGTRRVIGLLGSIFGFTLIAYVIKDILEINGLVNRDWNGIALLVPAATCISVTLATYVHAWRKGLLPARDLIIAAGVWLLTAAVILPLSWDTSGMTSIMYALAGGAWVVLPYAAWVLDFARLRNGEGAAVIVEKPDGASWSRNARLVVGLGVAIMVLFVVWLRWLAEPAFKATWRAKGLPTNLAEANAWYEPVEAKDNLALRCLSQAHVWNIYNIPKEKMEAINRGEGFVPPGYTGPSLENRSPYMYLMNMLPYVGAYPLNPGQHLTPAAWECIRFMWDDLGFEARGAAGRASLAGLTKSRYPIILNDAYNIQLDHLSKLRQLARMFSLDALIACVENRPHDAVEDILSILSIAASLEQEPVLTSQLARVAILDIAMNSLKDTLCRVSLTPEDMERIRGVLASTLPPTRDNGMFSRALVFQQLIFIDMLKNLDGDEKAARKIWLLPESPSSVMSRSLILRANYNPTEWSNWYRTTKVNTDTAPWWESGDVPGYVTMHSPLSEYIHHFGYTRTLNEAEHRARLNLDLARAALAIEQFRQVNGRLPEKLDELVPAYLEAVPPDPYAANVPVKYRIGLPPAPPERIDSKDHNEIHRAKAVRESWEKSDLNIVEYTVYSVYRDGVDDGGIQHNKDSGDLTFSVAPLEYRALPDVVPDTGMDDVYGGKAMIENAV